MRIPEDVSLTQVLLRSMGSPVCLYALHHQQMVAWVFLSLGDGLNMGCRVRWDANPDDLHEAYQQRGRHEDMSAALGQPSGMLPSSASTGRFQMFAWVSTQPVTRADKASWDQFEHDHIRSGAIDPRVGYLRASQRGSRRESALHRGDQLSVGGPPVGDEGGLSICARNVWNTVVNHVLNMESWARTSLKNKTVMSAEHCTQ